MTWLLCAVYGYLAIISLTNYLLMRRPRKLRPDQVVPEIVVLIPARDEEANLQRLLPQLLEPNPGLVVYVYDDDSLDKTREVALAAGARVIPGGPLPEGWTGKNHACYVLAETALRETSTDWIVYLDADVYPSPNFIPACQAAALRLRLQVGVLTAFPKLLPGKDLQPLFLAWVGWLLLATNPFGLTARTGWGHNQFTNGQFTLWRRSAYELVHPNETVRSSVLEDVQIGRLLAKRKVKVEVANFASVLSVKMYETWQQTLDGMSKNSYEITGTAWGTVAVAVFLFLLGWAWIAVPHWWLPFSLLATSGLFVTLGFRTLPLTFFTVPLWLSIGSFTVLRALHWRKTGRVAWKGRIYPS